MKNTMKHYAAMFVALIFFTLVLPGSSMATNDKNDKKDPKSVIDLKYIGNVNDQPVFRLNLQSADEDEYTVMFRDNYGNILYSERIKGTSVIKNFALDTEELGDEPLNVIVKAKKLNRTETYNINRKYSYTEQAVVNKVN